MRAHAERRRPRGAVTPRGTGAGWRGGGGQRNGGFAHGKCVRDGIGNVKVREVGDNMLERVSCSLMQIPREKSEHERYHKGKRGKRGSEGPEKRTASDNGEHESTHY